MKELTREEILERYPGNDIHPTAIIYDGVEMGTGNFIGPYSIIGGAAENVGYTNFTGKVDIGDNNQLTKQVTIDSGTEYRTMITDNCLLFKNAHVCHDANIYREVALACNVVIGGFTVVDSGCCFGLNSVVHRWLMIPAGCFFGMGSVVTKKSELKPGMRYVGNPVRCLGKIIRK